MKKRIAIRQQLIHFRRWSRKGYAVFSSLGKCVSIREVVKSVAEASLRKQPSYLDLAAGRDGERTEYAEEKTGGEIPDYLWQELLFTLLPQPLSTDSCISKHIPLNKYSRMPDSYSYVAIRHFFLRSQRS